MKKFAMIMALALPLAFASCGDDNDEKVLTLDQTAVTLNYGQSQKVKASENGATWGSSNEFVATVNDKGEIQAKHVGTATISATKDGSTAKCVVTVNATNDNFATYTLWGATVAQVKANASSDLVLLTDTADALMYTNANNAYPWYGFIFKNSGLAGSSIYFPESIFDDYDFNGYLAQHYTKIGAYDGEGVLYVNANSVSEASESAIVDYDTDLDVYTVLYQPVSHTKANYVDATLLKDAKALYKAAKK